MVQKTCRIPFDMILIKPAGIWLLIPPGNSLAGRTHLSPADLDGQPMVTTGPHNHIHRFVIDYCARIGVHPDVLAHATDPETIYQFSRETGAMFFVFENARETVPNGVTVAQLDIQNAEDFGTYAIRRHGTQPSRAAHLFWDELKTFY